MRKYRQDQRNRRHPLSDQKVIAQDIVLMYDAHLGTIDPQEVWWKSDCLVVVYDRIEYKYLVIFVALGRILMREKSSFL